MKHANMALIQFLLDVGAGINNVNFDGHNALYSAIYRQNEELFDLLLEYGADVHVCPNLLVRAAGAHNFSIIDKLLERSVDVDIIDRHGYTAFAHASGLADGRTMEFLHKERGAMLQPPVKLANVQYFLDRDIGKSVVEQVIEKHWENSREPLSTKHESE